jgi:antitoxin component YwqK of YwqJK toxin-antitoxin module
MAGAKGKGEPYVKYHADGSIWAKGWKEGDTPVGYWEFFRKDGTRMGSGTFDDGEKVGEWTSYDEAGKVHKVTTFRKKAK